MARFHPLQESPQPQTQEGRCFSLPCPGSLAPTETGAPLRAPKAASEVLSARRKGGLSAFPAGDPRWPLRPHTPPGYPFVSGGESCQRAPFPQHAPLCAHPPPGSQARAHLLICGSLSSRGSRFETESKEEAGSGSTPQPGRPVFPITTPSPGPPRSALPARRGHLYGRRKGLSVGIGGTYRCGAEAAGKGRAGPAACRAQVRPGAPSSRLAPAPPPAPGLGALSCAACSPPPRPELRLPPRRVAGRASPTPPVLPRRT